MSPNPLVTQTGHNLRILSTTLTEPHVGECLLCYVYRMLGYGCTGLRWACRHRDARATALERRLGERGGYCDREIFRNGYELAPQHRVQPRERDGGDCGDDDVYVDDSTCPDPMPTCRGVRAGSVRGCALWVRLVRR